MRRMDQIDLFTKRIQRSLLFVLVLLLPTSFIPPMARAEDARWAKIEKVYNTYCVQCHGIERNGTGINSKFMTVQPRDHTDPKEMGKIPDEEIIKAITYGGISVQKSILMPAWGKVLTQQEIYELKDYLRHVCNCGGESK
ncbi:cytochrome c [Methylacidiphilum fumariolicum]|uniref:Cytochrome c family protein n=2 Tax=Candidatus Methylacidiphilum fumarolicum TaxID=591154 RepID=I0JWU0_METFB|nr:cytochrome c [Candidatus Methylacidiphilum fumarolicum]MBW6414403.1 cytochrome c [Candidatus Methylacidiphilum fumarolicum]CAI9085488.1 Cytochrome c family protein [Candidatus Methylacidiphilum fumarolicum]CCG91709.1 Cytochrome c family protein [Methylacidiphilum fumariolicum SolV]